MSTPKYIYVNRIVLLNTLVLFSIAFIHKASAQSGNPYHINGNASQENCNCYILTPNQTFASGSVWNINKINLNQSFDYHFNVYLGCNDTEGADGIAFVLQPISTSIGSSGEGLGVEGVSPSVIVAIDTYQNTNKNDPAYDHLDIHLNGDLVHGTANNIAGPVQALAGSDNIEDCQWHVFRISWNTVSKVISVYMDGNQRLTANIDLVQTIFAGDPMVFWGFTAATGGATNQQKFCTSLNAQFSLPANQITCYPTPIQFVDSSTSFGNIVKWYWDFGDGTTDTTAHPPLHVYPEPGNYTVKLNILGNNGCISDTFRQQVVAGSKPLADFDFKSPPYCDDKMIPFNDLSGVAYGTIDQWKWTVNGTSFITNDTEFYKRLPVGVNNISLQVGTKEGCLSDIADKTLLVERHPEITISGRTYACKEEEVRFMATNETPALSIQSFNWNFGDSQTGSSNTAFHSYADTGTYTISGYAIADNGCSSDTLSQNIIIYGTYAFAGNDTVVAIGQSLQLQASGGKYFNWSPSFNLNDAEIANPVAAITDDITYTVTVSSDAGCATTDDITIKAFKGPEFYVPNAFTPNGDGKNDVFRFTAVGMTEVHYFNIFNRYGQMVYSSKNPGQGWDGKVNGRLQSTGTYVWMIAGKDYSGKIIKRKGIVTLLK
ncbi:MAG: gliding motility-associated C-terminal domain-containing protein [Chitinophagaceae bacterium]|nr:gliding motility-associated C-terminal domain-containing protein [Chitinophagaceae bacterium]